MFYINIPISPKVCRCDLWDTIYQYDTGPPFSSNVVICFQCSFCNGSFKKINFSFSLHHTLGVNTTSKEVTGPNATVKHSLLPDRQTENPPKRPKSAEGKTSANEQVKVCRKSKDMCQLCYNNKISKMLLVFFQAGSGSLPIKMNVYFMELCVHLF